MDEDMQQDTGVVIDLADISQRARKVVEIYDGLASGDRPEPGVLDEALEQLDAGPRPPGQLGSDIALIASGGRGANKQSAVSAIERLRRITTMKSTPPMARRWRPRARQRHNRQRADTRQLQLPGFEQDNPMEAS
jgi:hypothetical protein